MDYGRIGKGSHSLGSSEGLAGLHFNIDHDGRTSIPDTSSGYLRLGVLATADGRLDQAEAAFQMACRLDPGCSGAYTGLAVVYQQKGLLKAAFDMYLKGLQLDNDNLIALLGLFQASCQMGSFANIIHYLELYLRSHPCDTSVMFCLAALYVRDGQIQKARPLLNELLVLDPSNSDAANLLEEIENCLIQGSADVVKR